MALFKNATAKGSVTVPGDLILAVVTVTLIAVVVVFITLY